MKNKEDKMSSNSTYTLEKLPYGKKEIEFQIPTDNYLGTIIPQFFDNVGDEEKSIMYALANPIGSLRLRDIARKGMKTVIVINDITRPTPTAKMLPPLIEELAVAGVVDTDITILIANGTHRDNTPEEIDTLIGKDLHSRFNVINHHCRDEEMLVTLGITSHEVPVIVNRLLYEADLKILTGTIVPHHSAGFSGGRKSIIPGCASVETLRLHHGYKMRSPEPAMGWVEGNPFHQTAVEAARMVKADFILNVVQNQKKQITHAVAGDIEKAWEKGVEACRGISEIDTPDDVDIIIASPGGHPKDINLYQSQKAMAAAELVIKKGGTIILPVSCPDGVGAELFYQWMKEAEKLEDVGERFKKEGFSEGTSKAWLYARCLLKAELIVVSENLSEETLSDMFTKKAETVDQAIQMALASQGKDAKILLMRNAGDIVPKRKARNYI